MKTTLLFLSLMMHTVALAEDPKEVSPLEAFKIYKTPFAQEIKDLERIIPAQEKFLEDLVKIEKKMDPDLDGAEYYKVARRVKRFTAELEEMREQLVLFKLEQIKANTEIYFRFDCTNKNLSRAMKTLKDGIKVARMEVDEKLGLLKLKEAELDKSGIDLKGRNSEIDFLVNADATYDQYISKRNLLAQQKEDELSKIPSWHGTLGLNSHQANKVTAEYDQKSLDNAYSFYFKMMNGYNQLTKRCQKDGRLVDRAEESIGGDLENLDIVPAPKKARKQ